MFDTQTFSRDLTEDNTSNDTSSNKTLPLKIIILIAILLSLMASLYIIIIYICYPRTRNFAFKMVFYLNIADFCFSVAELLSFGHPNFMFEVSLSEGMCLAQSFMITWFGLSSIFWTSIIAWTLYSTVICNDTNIESKEAQYLILGFLLPLVAALLPFMTKDYGSNGSWCWFQTLGNNLKRSILELCYFYIELWIAFLFNSVIIYKVIRALKLVGVTGDDSWVIKLRFYPLILIICWIWGTALQICFLVNPDFIEKKMDWLMFLSLFFCSLQGILNAIIYGLNVTVRKIIRKHLSLCFLRRDASQMESIVTNCNRTVEMDSVAKNGRESLSVTWSFDPERESAQEGN